MLIPLSNTDHYSDLTLTIYIYIYIYIYTYIHTYIHTYIYIHANEHAHAHTQEDNMIPTLTQAALVGTVDDARIEMRSGADVNAPDSVSKAYIYIYIYIYISHILILIIYTYIYTYTHIYIYISLSVIQKWSNLRFVCIHTHIDTYTRAERGNTTVSCCIWREFKNGRIVLVCRSKC